MTEDRSRADMPVVQSEASRNTSERPESDSGWHWLIRVPVGVLLSLCAIACGAFSSVLILDPPPKNPVLAQCMGAVIILLCIWVLSLGIRLIVNRPNRGGLLSPFVLKLVAVYMGAMPIFMIVTGRSSEWSVVQYLQAGLFIFGSAGVWRLAAARQGSASKHER